MARYYGSTAIAAVLAGTTGAAGVAKADRVTYELVVSFTDFGGTEYTADLSFTYELGLTGTPGGVYGDPAFGGDVDEFSFPLIDYSVSFTGGDVDGITWSMAGGNPATFSQYGTSVIPAPASSIAISNDASADPKIFDPAPERAGDYILLTFFRETASDGQTSQLLRDPLVLASGGAYSVLASGETGLGLGGAQIDSSSITITDDDGGMSPIPAPASGAMLGALLGGAALRDAAKRRRAAKKRSA